MRAAAVRGDHKSDAGFCHEALLYSGRDEFLQATGNFIRDGIAAGEPVLVVVSAEKIALLRGDLDRDAEFVQCADMSEVGSNPARIIQAWRDFVAERGDPGRPARGIGEPIGSDRSPAELAECQRHESLLNVAFAATNAFRLMCPYDTETLDPAVVEEVLCSHPVVTADGARRESASYMGLEAAAGQCQERLPEPVPRPKELYFEAASLVALRQYVALRAGDAGLDSRRTEDVLLAVNEVATNSLRHAGGAGVLRVWEDPHGLVCEVRDGGSFDMPLAGRLRPIPGQLGGYGLWLANQLCDLLQIRSLPAGTVVRLHMRRA
jgi:anti-sigma regulatory factor (Ser/Thr protein kinase)